MICPGNLRWIALGTHRTPIFYLIYFNDIYVNTIKNKKGVPRASVPCAKECSTRRVFGGRIIEMKKLLLLIGLVVFLTPMVVSAESLEEQFEPDSDQFETIKNIIKY